MSTKSKNLPKKTISKEEDRLNKEIIFYEKIKNELKTIVSYTGLNAVGLDMLFSPENMPIWNRAFTHITYSSDDFDSYEWLGDRVLEKNLSCLIFDKFPGLTEGDYTHIKIEYIKGSTFAEMAKKYKLFRLIRSRSIPAKYIENQMAGDVFESFFGALYTAGEKLGKGIGDVITRNVSSKMFTFEGIEESYSKRNGPDITTITQSMKQLTTYEPSVKKVPDENNGYQDKYELVFPKQILSFFKTHYDKDFVKLGLTNQNGLYRAIFENNEDTAKHSLYAQLSDSLEDEKVGLTKEWFREKRYQKMLDECADIYYENNINSKEIFSNLDKRMEKEGYVALLSRVPGKKGKKRMPTPIIILYGLRDTQNENGLPFEEKVPLLMHETGNRENAKIITARLVEEYAHGASIDTILKSKNVNDKKLPGSTSPGKFRRN